MNNLEEKLTKIKFREVGQDAKESLWHSILLAQTERKQKVELSVFNFSFTKMSIIASFILALVLGTGGVVAASNSAVPGDFLFPMDLAVEKVQMRFSGDEREAELRLRFAEERISEIKRVSEERTVRGELVVDLSDADVMAIEADVFTNETTVKIEADGKNFGYLSALKTRAELVKEISSKYSVSESRVDAFLDFEVENRASRADDKNFLNKTGSIRFSDDEEEDVGRALTDLEELLSDEDGEQAQELKKSLEDILILLGDDGELEIRKNGNKIKIESEDGKMEIKVKSDDSGSGKSDDNSDDSDDDSDDNSDENSNDSSININLGGSISIGDQKEDDSEVFCRGEWRDPEDCDSSKDDDKDDNSGSGKDDDSNDDDGSSGHGSDD